MGKVKRKRTKLHASAAATSTADRSEDNKPAQDDTTTTSPLPRFQMPDNVFSKLDIDLASLQRQLASGDPQDSDVRSAITSKSLRGLNLKKKDKRKLRKDVWMKKVDILQTVKKEAKAKKKRQKTAVVGDMKPLEDTLPTLDLLLKETSTHHAEPEESTTKTKAIKKSWTRQKQMMKDISLFHQVLEHPEYKANPLSTISQHLKNKLAQEEAMDT